MTMDAMPAHNPRHGRLSTAGKWWLAIAVTFAIAGMATGFWFSFWNLSTAAAAHGWHTPWALPLVIDLGIPTYVIIDHLIVTLGWHSRLPRLAAWGFAALTIALNGAFVTDPSPLWRITAAAMPAVWVLGIETLRLLWRVLRKDPTTRPEQIPAGRWAADPVGTFFMWRRKHLHNVTTYRELAARENARQRARDVIAAAAELTPPKAAPPSLRRAVRTGSLPAKVLEAIGSDQRLGTHTTEDEVDAWVGHGLTLSERVSQALQAQPQNAPQPPVQTVPAGASESAPEPPRQRAAQNGSESAVERANRIARRKGPRQVPWELLLDATRELHDSGHPLTAYRVAKALPVGEPKAAELVAAAGLNGHH